MELRELLKVVRDQAKSVDEGLSGIGEALANTSRDSDPSRYAHLAAQEAILAGAKSALIMVEAVTQQLIDSYGPAHQAPKELMESCELIRNHLQSLSTTVASGVAINITC